MLTLRKPSQLDIARILCESENSPYSYAEVGETKGVPPKGFRFNSHRILLGHGEQTFVRGKEAISQWRMFPTPMAQLFGNELPLEPGLTVAVLFHVGLLWSTNLCRVVYTFDEQGDIDRFGFAYGTLPEHVECGEERFEVQWLRADDSVWYEISVFARPQHPLVKLGHPYARYQQRRFRKLSGEAMQKATA